jgi:multiple sugar transport system permease protein
MASTSAAEIGRPTPGRRTPRRHWTGHLKGSEYVWALAFVVPYVAVFILFVAYPIAYGVWMGRSPALYAYLFSTPLYVRTVVNTLLYVAIGVNLDMVLALLLSGLFMVPGWPIKALLVIFILPWAVPGLPIFLSIRWMLNGDWGLLNNVLWNFFHVNGPEWLSSRWLAFGAMVLSHIWKSLPGTTIIFIVGRLGIPTEVYEAAVVDGATGPRRFMHITLPLLGNLYLINTLLATIFLFGDFNTPFLVTGGGPARETETLALLSINLGFGTAHPALGVACMMSALPIMIPLVVFLMRKLRAMQVEL